MAVELLIRLHDGSGGRKRGDIISLKQVPHAGWGSGETPPTYTIIRITNVDKDQVVQYCKRHTEGVRSLYRIKKEDLPQNVIDDLKNGYHETIKSKIIGFFQDRRTE